MPIVERPTNPEDRFDNNHLYELLWWISNLSLQQYINTGGTESVTSLTIKNKDNITSNADIISKISNKLAYVLGNPFNTKSGGEINTIWNTFITHVNERKEDGDFDPTDITLIEILDWMLDNSGGGEGSGFTETELTLITTLKNNVLSETKNEFDIQPDDTETTLFIKTVGFIFDILQEHKTSTTETLNTLNTELGTIQNHITNNLDPLISEVSNNTSNITSVQNHIIDNLNPLITEVSNNTADIMTLQNSMTVINNLNNELTSELNKIEGLDDKLIYALNETRNLGDTYNLITYDPSIDLSPTVKWNLYVYKDKIMFDNFIYYGEGIGIPNKLPYTLSHINTFIYYIDTMQYTTLINDLINYVKTGDLDSVYEFITNTWPTFIYKTDFLYETNDTLDHYGMLKENKNYSLESKEYILSYLNSDSITSISPDMLLNVQVSSEIDSYIDRTDICITDTTDTILTSFPITKTSVVEFKNVFFRDEVNSPATVPYLNVLKHPEKLKLIAKINKIVSGSEELQEEVTFNYNSLTGIFSYDFSNVTFDTGYSYKVHIVVEYNKIELKDLTESL